MLDFWHIPVEFPKVLSDVQNHVCFQYLLYLLNNIFIRFEVLLLSSTVSQLDCHSTLVQDMSMQVCGKCMGGYTVPPP
jgi:hypothetical protein